jgi:oxygen-independent coproporphyrinogen III oxidase
MGTVVGKIDLELLKRFNRPGPRYTSYPTAPIFSNSFTDDDYITEINTTNVAGKDNDISLYAHFPFCEQLCYFCGCNMRVSHDRSLIKKYNEYLKREIAMIAARISPSRKLSQMHWGGGTPSYLTPAEIADVGAFIKERFELAHNIEASVEIDPRGLTEEHIVAFRGSGFNRISMGVQDFELSVQEAINRVQSEAISRQAVYWARQAGFESVNLDLIYGLPHQTLDSFAVTVDKVIDISPDRIAVFNYAHVPWLKKHQNLIKTEDLPSADDRLQILQMTIDRLTRAGYQYIGMDHFAKAGDELAVAQNNRTLYRNFQGYSTKAGCDVYAFGMSAISQFENIYAQNVKTVNEYFERIDAGRAATKVGYRMTRDDHVRKETIMQIMCHLSIDKRSIEARFGIDFDQYFVEDLPKLSEFVDEGLLEVTDERIQVAGQGKLIIRNIAMCFDAHLPQMTAEKPVFSKTV